MKKTVAVILLGCIIVLGGCTNKISSNLGGTWTFKTTGFTATSFAKGYGIVTVTNQPTPYATDYTTLTVNFYGGLPHNSSTSNTYNGTYVVKPGVNLDSVNQVTIALNNAYTGTNALYHATATNSNVPVYVTVTNGSIAVSGAGIELVNVNDPTDSGALTFNITQP